MAKASSFVSKASASVAATRKAAQSVDASLGNEQLLEIVGRVEADIEAVRRDVKALYGSATEIADPAVQEKLKNLESALNTEIPGVLDSATDVLTVSAGDDSKGRYRENA